MDENFTTFLSRQVDPGRNHPWPIMIKTAQPIRGKKVSHSALAASMMLPASRAERYGQAAYRPRRAKKTSWRFPACRPRGERQTKDVDEKSTPSAWESADGVYGD